MHNVVKNNLQCKCSNIKDTSGNVNKELLLGDPEVIWQSNILQTLVIYYLEDLLSLNEVNRKATGEHSCLKYLKVWFITGLSQLLPFVDGHDLPGPGYNLVE